MEETPQQPNSRDVSSTTDDDRYQYGSALKSTLCFSTRALATLGTCSILSLPILLFVFWDRPSKPCMDGNLELADNSPYDVKTIFAITAGFGSFDFGIAKTIDIIFDLFVGRGGQLLLGIIAYPIISNAVLHEMETHPASYAFFTSISFNTTSIPTVFYAVKHTARRCRQNWNLKSFLYGIGISLSILYVIAFPTLISATTGYSTSQEPAVNMEDGTIVLLSKFQSCAYVIIDGSRIEGYPDNFCVKESWGSIYSKKAEYPHNPYASTESYYNNYIKQEGPSSGLSFFSGEQIRLEGALLNIELNGYAFENKTYSGKVLEEKGFCKPDDAQDKMYQWGFSYLLLLIMVLLTYAWTAIILMLRWDTKRHSRLAKSKRGLGTYRAILDISRAMQVQLGDKSQYFTNKELEKRLEKAPEGIQYYFPDEIGQAEAVSQESDDSTHENSAHTSARAEV
ncbi:uncharacterized protein K452DRAFT_360019 [Aplosporella prunicola CBS 121167]|uniref:Uncharacterized protein n=1 Tax=Aplosporella prunicola CBS 121167 TaxID=1176127 RepID=A0A6A6BAY7_9PEZI|nr:uncharacterized protein K452DRAFT_360019 [Aplosporella prunicola CBS 121167]KAF2140405.1 hypothetical protein K452DRAFT_360019 [Aplosporella prunicola CBS 121167]